MAFRSVLSASIIDLPEHVRRCYGLRLADRFACFVDSRLSYCPGIVQMLAKPKHLAKATDVISNSRKRIQVFEKKWSHRCGPKHLK